MDTLHCLVLRLGGQRVKESGASGDKNNSRHSVIFCVSFEKCKPTANLFHVCDSAAVPLCLSVAALKDIVLNVINLQ